MASFTLSGKRVVVMGLGRFGGGVGVSRYLVQQNARVLVTDLLPAEKLAPSLAALQGLPIDYRLGEHRVEDFQNADLIVVNPAVDRRNNPYLQAAVQAGVPLTSEIRLLVSQLPNRQRTIGVTGTAGKSTTTAMIGHILARRLGPDRVHVGGNLGGSLLESLSRIRPTDWVVLELSSFMLEDLAADRWSPHVAVITNISPNHLDRHDSFQDYVRAKQHILEYQAPTDLAVLGTDLPPQIQPRHSRVIRMPADLGGTIPLSIPGKHNQANAWLAIEATLAADISPGQAVAALRDFPGLPHRLQLVAEHQGVRFFNDSKATTPEAAMLALQCFPRGVVHIILGGYDKKSDLSGLATAAAHHCRAIYTIGTTGPAIAAAAQAANGPAQVYECHHLDNAVQSLMRNIRPGDVVLLSPGCASWDQFDNYEARGQAFIHAVHARLGIR